MATPAQAKGFNALARLGIRTVEAERRFMLREKQVAQLVLNGFFHQLRHFFVAVNPCFPYLEFFAKYKPCREDAKKFHVWTIAPAGPIAQTGWWTNGAICLPNTDPDLGQRGPKRTVQSIAPHTVPIVMPPWVLPVTKFHAIFQPEIFWHTMAKPVLPVGYYAYRIFVDAHYIDYCLTRNPDAKFYADPKGSAVFADMSPLPGPIRIGGIRLPEPSREFVTWMEKRFYGKDSDFPNIRRCRDRG